MENYQDKNEQQEVKVEDKKSEPRRETKEVETDPIQKMKENIKKFVDANPGTVDNLKKLPYDKEGYATYLKKIEQKYGRKEDQIDLYSKTTALLQAVVNYAHENQFNDKPSIPVDGDLNHTTLTALKGLGERTPLSPRDRVIKKSVIGEGTEKVYEPRGYLYASNDSKLNKDFEDYKTSPEDTNLKTYLKTNLPKLLAQ